MKILLLDNYDSFTYNIVHLLRELGISDISVQRNDKIELRSVEAFDGIVLSPGPGIPNEAGIMPDLVKYFASSKPILGVCLGHQCIGEVFGARLRNLSAPVHGQGRNMQILDNEEDLFLNLPRTFIVGRYHSWVVDMEEFPDDLLITGQDEDGEIMALKHKKFNVRGLQFHPESVLTEYGGEIMKNWLRGIAQ